MNATIRAAVPQMSVAVDRTKAEELNISTGQVFQALATYVGSSFVGQINKFGLTFQVYAQADAAARLTPADIEALPVQSRERHDGAAGDSGEHHAEHRAGGGAACIICIRQQRSSGRPPRASVRARRLV